MARKFKKISNDIGVDIRENGYYSTPDFVVEYLTKRLMANNPNGKLVFDCCVGREEMARYFSKDKYKFVGMDLYKYKEKYENMFIHMDFVEFYKQNKNKTLEYDLYIFNPPYNCHEVDYIKNNKDNLSILFDDVGIHNMYSMFISAIIDIAKEGAIIGVITLDSFLSSISHKELRNKILSQCSILEMILAPTDLFLGQGADVRTTIMILKKGKNNKNKIRVKNRVNNKIEFLNLLKNEEDFTYFDLEEMLLNSKIDNNEFVIDCEKDILSIFDNKRIGDYFKCVTGISTGKDSLYIRKEKTDGFSIPFYKNPGNDRFYTEKVLYLDDNFLEHDKNIKNFMVRNKQLLYKGGITCSSMGVTFTACNLPENSTYGVNPNIIVDDEDKWWLLGYLNSELVSYMIRGILNRSNMITSGYVSRLPVVNFSKIEKQEISRISKNIYNKAKNKENFHLEFENLNEIINKYSKLSDKSINLIKEFNKDIVRNT